MAQVKMSSCVMRRRDLMSTWGSSPACLPCLRGVGLNKLHHCIIAPKLRAAQINTKISHARQLTGTAMLRPAASPWKTFAHRSSAATARRSPIAARCININATSSTSDSALEPQVNVEASTVLGQSPGMTLLYEMMSLANI